MSTKDAISWLASVSTIGLFCTGIPICRKIVRKGNSSDTSFFPLLLMFCAGVMWTKYGFMKNEPTLIYVNSVGAILGLIYSAIYYAFTLQKSSVHRQMLIGCALMFPMLIYVKIYATDRDKALFYLGLNCSTCSVISYGAPLAAVSEVLRLKSTEIMAFPLSMANFLVAMEWILYGYVINDMFVQVPNTLGFILSSFQLYLFYKYPSSKGSSSGTTTV